MPNMNFITPGHVRAYQVVTSQDEQKHTTLASCTINGEPGVAIVLVDRIAGDKVAVLPLFVAITPTMDIEFDGSDWGSSDGEQGGGPRQADPSTLRMFAASKASLDPTG